jgi:hypothetical protein
MLFSAFTGQHVSGHGAPSVLGPLGERGSGACAQYHSHCHLWGDRPTGTVLEVWHDYWRALCSCGPCPHVDDSAPLLAYGQAARLAPWLRQCAAGKEAAEGLGRPAQVRRLLDMQEGMQEVAIWHAGRQAHSSCMTCRKMCKQGLCGMQEDKHTVAA